MKQSCGRWLCKRAWLVGTVYMRVKDPCGIGYFLTVLRSTLQKQHRGGRVDFGLQFEEIQSIMVETSRLLECEAVGHVVCSARKQRGTKAWVQFAFPFLLSIGPQTK